MTYRFAVYHSHPGEVYDFVRHIPYLDVAKIGAGNVIRKKFMNLKVNRLTNYL